MSHDQGCCSMCNDPLGDPDDLVCDDCLDAELSHLLPAERAGVEPAGLSHPTT